MSDARISALTVLSTPASDDLIAIVDVSDPTDGSTGTTKRITKGYLAGVWTKETPSGVFDGSNVTYTLAHNCVASSGNLYVNGQLYVEGVDYTVTGLSSNNITLTTALLAGYTGSFIFHYQYSA